MTLTEIANFVTTVLSDTTSDSVSVCKDFINRRYQFVWDTGLWTETLGIASKAVSAGTSSSTVDDLIITIDSEPDITFYQSVVAPATFIDFPVAIKFTETGKEDGLNLLNDSWMTFFQIDPNAWENVSARRANPTNFINLPKDGNGFCRIKPVPVPSAAGTLFVLGKLKWVALGDSDSPALNGIDNALIHFATGDMLKRARQREAGDRELAEATAHVQIMVDMETSQRQSISRIIPYVYDDYTFREVIT